MYTPDGKIIMDTSRDTIGTLLKNGSSRYFAGNDYLKNDEYKSQVIDFSNTSIIRNNNIVVNKNFNVLKSSYVNN